MNIRRIGIVAAVGAAAVAIGTGIASAQPDDGEGTPITGEALTKASQAALAFTGGGTVTGSEVGDEESYYEVEVTKADGSQVDVQLDQNFALVGSKTDGAGRRHRTRRRRQLDDERHWWPVVALAICTPLVSALSSRAAATAPVGGLHQGRRGIGPDHGRVPADSTGQ